MMMALHAPFSVAQNAGKASAVVLDSLTRDPVPYVHIVNMSRGYGAFTNGEGRFSIQTLGGGEFKISCIGYQTRKMPAEALCERDTILLRRHLLELAEFTVGAEPLDAKKIIKAALKKFKKTSSTADKVFRGYYEERLATEVQELHLRSVFLVTRYENTARSPLFQFESDEDFVVLAIDKVVDGEPPLKLNGLSWLAKTGKVRDMLRFEGDWKEARIDSVTYNGENHLYWITAHNKYGPSLRTIITDSMDFLMITDCWFYKSLEVPDAAYIKILFEPRISLQYPVFYEFYNPLMKYDGRDVCMKYSMLLLSEEQGATIGEKDLMDHFKTLWQTKALFGNFDWSEYEHIRFPD